MLRTGTTCFCVRAGWLLQSVDRISWYVPYFSPAFEKIVPYLTHPLVLVGFALLLFFGVHRLLIQSGIIPPLDKKAGSAVVLALLRYGFWIALAVIVLGFGLQFFETRGQANGGGAVLIGAGGDVVSNAASGGVSVMGNTGTVAPANANGTEAKASQSETPDLPEPPPNRRRFWTARETDGVKAASRRPRCVATCRRGSWRPDR